MDDPLVITSAPLDDLLFEWANKLVGFATECDTKGHADGKHYSVTLPATTCMMLARLLLDAMSEPASAGEAGTAETPKSGSARRASTRPAKRGTPK